MSTPMCDAEIINAALAKINLNKPTEEEIRIALCEAILLTRADEREFPTDPDFDAPVCTDCGGTVDDGIDGCDACEGPLCSMCGDDAGYCSVCSDEEEEDVENEEEELALEDNGID